VLGRYSPQEAAKLLERFEQAGIPFRTHPRRPFPQPGPSVTVDIAVDSARIDEVERITRDLFSDGLPNYESSFFGAHRNI
jgi:hypothetical protein